MKHNAFRLMMSILLISTVYSNLFAYDACIDGFYYDFLGNEATLVNPSNSKEDRDVTDFSGDISMPGTVSYQDKNYIVTKIGEGAFYGSQNLTSIVIPNTIIAIGGSAFSGCTNLTSVYMPNTIKSIGASAFAYCGSLANISIPQSLEYIHGSAFDGSSYAEWIDSQP